MLISIVLTLISATDVTLPAQVGRANYAATLQALATVDPALVTALHDADGPKPLTCSSILNSRANRGGILIRAGQPYDVRITGLTAPVSAALEQALLSQPLTTWELEHHRFQVAAVTCDAAVNRWSGRTTYETLAATQLLRSDNLPRHATLDFVSPTAFKSGGITVPVPLPNLVFGSLVERWNQFSPITLSPEMRRFGEEMVAISRYHLESQPVDGKQGGLRIGGVGQATYIALGGDRYWLGLLNMLADFTLYSGVGVQTTTGMGQARRVE